MEIFLDNQKLDIQIEIADTIDTIVKSVEEFAKKHPDTLLNYLLSY